MPLFFRCSHSMLCCVPLFNIYSGHCSQNALRLPIQIGTVIENSNGSIQSDQTTHYKTHKWTTTSFIPCAQCNSLILYCRKRNNVRIDTATEGCERKQCDQHTSWTHRSRCVCVCVCVCNFCWLKINCQRWASIRFVCSLAPLFSLFVYLFFHQHQLFPQQNLMCNEIRGRLSII